MGRVKTVTIGEEWHEHIITNEDPVFAGMHVCHDCGSLIHRVSMYEYGSFEYCESCYQSIIKWDKDWEDSHWDALDWYSTASRKSENAGLGRREPKW